ncbi:MAG: phage tail sheath subtilisin-like domain-containing protein [Caenibius sp.]
MPFLHGIKVNEINEGTRPIKPGATAIIGLVATASHSDDGEKDAAVQAAFPLNTPVLVTSVRKAIGEAGDTGTLKPALQAIADQTSPIIIVVRVATGEGADEAAIAADQETKIIGDVVDNVYTGMNAFLAAEAQTGVRPRILGVPGFDNQAVTTALIPIAQKLRAMVYAQATGDSVAEAKTYGENFGQRELMLLWPRFENAFLGDTVARAMGLRAKIDEEIGFHKTISNVVVNGVTGLDRDVFFDLNDQDSDAGVLNDGNIVALIRRDGYRFWGNRTLSSEPLFAFESAVRTAQVLQDEMVEGLIWAVDKPITRVLIRDIIETINARFRRLVATGKLIGATAWFDPDLNPAEQLAAGQLAIDYDYTPAAPLEGLELNQRITDRYYANFADLVA